MEKSSILLVNVQGSYGENESSGINNQESGSQLNSSTGTGSSSWSSHADSRSYNANRKKFCCPRCNRGYTRIYDMKTHYQFQCGKAPRYQCRYCAKTDKFSSNMYNHVRKMHRNEPLVIIDLFKQLSRTSYIDSEYYSTSIDVKFVCPQCKRNFRRMKGLKQHMTYECNRQPRFQCPYCCQRSKLLSNLYKHVRRIHVGNKVWGIDLHQQ
ncbi:zinc finger protein 235-like [Leptopilina heterotoma]|uniref:zinc finger protein 235-like n=1 Tax=Leptopilina heterotoma TaxID=63436 RepID=UPI001CA816EC|nr:zinc finger protein 235-like [Leptopilina heterotoma]